MYIALVYRPEAAADPDGKHSDDPFDGTELVAYGLQDDVERVVDDYSSKHPDWKFAIEAVTDSVQT